MVYFFRKNIIIICSDTTGDGRSLLKGCALPFLFYSLLYLAAKALATAAALCLGYLSPISGWLSCWYYRTEYS